MISIVVIDNEIQDMERIKDLIRAHGDLDLRGFGTDGYDAVRLVSTIKPDIAILDVDLDLYCGMEISHLLKRESPSTAIIAMGSLANIDLVKRVMNGAVAAYILKETDLDLLAEIVRKVHRGENYFNPRICAFAFDILSSLLQDSRAEALPYKRFPDNRGFPKGSGLPIPKLSRTEVKILAFLGEGYSDGEIAGKLRLSVGTVRNYISTVMRKIGRTRRTQAVVFALQNGLSVPS